jgi:hypothetical protein
MGWYRLITDIDARALFGIGGGGSVSDGVYVRRSYGSSAFSILVDDGSSGASVTLLDPYDSSRYYHLCITSHGGTDATGVHFVLGYVDGRLAARAGSGHAATDILSTRVAAIGAPNYISSMQGFVAHFRAWRVALTPQEVYREYRSALPVRRADLVADLPFASDDRDLVARAAWTGGTSGTEQMVWPPLYPVSPRAYWLAGTPQSAELTWLTQARVVGEQPPLVMAG